MGACQPAELSNYYRARRSFLARKASQFESGFALIIGDSHIEGLAIEKVDAYALNAGIGGDTSRGALERLADYEPLQRWRYIVLAIGFNDLEYRGVDEIKANYQKILNRIGSNVPVYLLSVLTVDSDVTISKHSEKNEVILSLNTVLKEEAASRHNTRFIDLYSLTKDEAGSLSYSLHVGDGVHLNETGQEIVIDRLKDFLPVAGR